MADVMEIIDAKIRELKESIENEKEELEKAKSFKHQSKCRKIIIVSMLFMLIASTYVLIVVTEIREFLIWQAVIYIAFIGVSAIPRHMFNDVLKRIERMKYMERKIEGLEWLKTRSSDQQENFINTMEK